MKSLTVAGTAFALLLLAPGVGLAEGDFTVPQDTLAYSSPSTDANALPLNKGTELFSKGCRDDGWCEFRHANLTAPLWVRAETIGLGAAPDEAEAPETSEMSDGVNVNGDVDLYDVPGGEGEVIGMLAEGSSVSLLQCKSDNWCEVEGGWVWGDFLDH